MTDLAIPAEPDDRSLLDAFRHHRNHRNQEAFARLVERHGPWV